MSKQNIRKLKFLRTKTFDLLLACSCFLFVLNENIIALFASPQHSKENNHYHLCPSCGFEYSYASKSSGKSIINLHKILECNKTSYKSVYSLGDKFPNVSSYVCKCKYTKETRKNCSSQQTLPKSILAKNFKQSRVKSIPHQKALAIDVDNVNAYLGENFSSTKACLVAYVGMAIKGSNLMYRQWMGKENCFNLCINTTIRNGFTFDCRSFEHWHSQCPYTNIPKENNGLSLNGRNVCASFTSNNDQSYNEGFSANKNARSEKQSNVKIDYCVLSDQTILTSGNEFSENNAVTYYEILCERPTLKTTTFSYTKSSKEIQALVSIDSTLQQSTEQSQIKGKTNRVRVITSTIKIISSKTTSPIKLNIDETSSESYQNKTECEFNPCLNQGACLLLDERRFICSCKKFFFGVYCENKGIEEICHKDKMEILVEKNIARAYGVKLNLMYVNKKETECKLENLNETHAIFRLPYEKCFTKSKKTKEQNVYTNKLYTLERYLGKFECRIDHVKFTKADPPKPLETRLIEAKPCLLDLLNLKITLFNDEHFNQEIFDDTDASNENSEQVKSNERVFFQLSVSYSEKLDKMYQQNKRMQFFHLTLENCWLSTSFKNEKDEEKFQIIIQNGCPRETVTFFEAPDAKNTIRFSFIMTEKVDLLNITQAFIHCFPEICTDAPITSKDYSFYSQFKSCHNSTNECLFHHVPARSKRNDQEEKELLIESVYAVKNDEQIKETEQFFPCPKKLSKGPFFIKQKQQGEINARRSSSKRILNVFNFYILIGGMRFLALI